MIVGGLFAVVATIALGLGIGYSVWGTSSTAAAPKGAEAPAPRIVPGLGRAGFLGVEVVSSGFAPGATQPASPQPTPASPSPTTSTPGAYVVGVVPSSPAARAGIVKGDTITSIGGHEVRSALTLRVDVLRLAPKSRVEVGWETSSGKHESATVTLARRPTTRSIG